MSNAHMLAIICISSGPDPRHQAGAGTGAAGAVATGVRGRAAVAAKARVAIGMGSPSKWGGRQGLDAAPAERAQGGLAYFSLAISAWAAAGFRTFAPEMK